MENKKPITTHTIAAMGMMVALVFASNYIQIPLPPTAIGVTRIHIANGICLLAALMFGGLKGGIAAGLGSFCYDLTNPAYVAESWITFIMKFLMAFMCGLIVYLGKKHKNGDGPATGRVLTGTIIGAFSYVVLYIAKQYIYGYTVLGVTTETITISLATKLPASVFNAIIAVPVAYFSYNLIRMPLRRAGLAEKFGIR